MSLSNCHVNCPLEDCQYRAIPTSVRKHLKEKHKTGESVIQKFNESLKAAKAEAKGTHLYRCEQCSKTYTSRGSMLDHVRKDHRKFLDPAAISLATVDEPEIKKFRVATGEVKAADILTDIPTTKEMRNQRIKCPYDGCCNEFESMLLGSRATLLAHFGDEHNIDIDLEKHQFDSKEKFEAWLGKREEETGTKFCTHTTKKDNQRVTIFSRCIHEGSYQSRGEKKLGHETRKQTGGAVCTAYLKVFCLNDVYDVEACFYHFGHEVSVADLPLSVPHKNRVVELVKLGLPSRAIISQVKKETNPDSRLYYLTPDDIRNLKNAFNLIADQLDSDDLKSVQKRVMLKDPKDGFRYFQMPDDKGSGFCIVIITSDHLESIKQFSHKIVLLDDTHNVTQYGLKLTTMTVIDNSDKSEPAGFLLTSSTTSSEVAIFFNELKKLYPDFKPKYMMTDEAAAFWNGFSTVFDNSNTQKVICRWHVFRSWKKKAKALVKNEDLLREVLQSLREILREPKMEKLMHRIISLLTVLDKKPDIQVKEFAAYFRTYYYDRITEWSTASRSHIACHTSMYSEAFHSFLKKEIIVQRKGIRCDKLISLLFVASNFILESKSDKKARKLASACPRKGQNRTICRAMKAEMNKYVIRQTISGSFSVSSTSGHRENWQEYEVEDHLDCFCDSRENTHCDYCGACAYRFYCSCLFSKGGVACKHVHAALLFLDKNITIDQLTFTDLDPPSPSYDDQFVNIPAHGCSSSRSEKQTVSISLNHRPVYGEEKENDMTKRMDQLTNMWSLVYGGLRKKRSDRDEQFENELLKVETALQALLTTNNTTSLVARPDAHTATKSARETMHALKKKKKSRSEAPTTSRISLLPKRQLSRCTICGECDPPLPPDAHALEFESRVTEWKRCRVCKNPVHFSCSLANKQCHCSPNSFFEIYPIDYENEMDSDEVSSCSDY